MTARTRRIDKGAGPTPGSGVTRRRFMVASAAGAGLSFPLVRARKSAAATSLKILKWSHFVPAYDDWYQKFAREWGRKNNVDVVVDRLRDEELYPRQAAEASSGSGHDIVQFWGAGPHVYKDRLVDLSDLGRSFATEVGEWSDIAKQVGLVDGRWLSLPEYFSVILTHYRRDLFEQVAEKPPETWDDLLRAGRKLKKLGHPVGAGLLAHNLDDGPNLRSLMLSFGAHEVAEDGKTITISSRQTREALKYMAALYQEAQDPEVLGWDGAGNNLCLISGKCSMILNPVSAILGARKNNPKVGAQVSLALIPRGPAGRFMSTNVLSNAIWKFSPVQDVARKFLRDYFVTTLKDAFIASEGYNYPAIAAPFTKPPMPIYDRDPEFGVIPEQARHARAFGYPGPTTKAAEAVFNQWVLNDLFAKVATGTNIEEGLRWAEAKIGEIYRQHA